MADRLSQMLIWMIKPDKFIIYEYTLISVANQIQDSVWATRLWIYQQKDLIDPIYSWLRMFGYFCLRATKLTVL